MLSFSDASIPIYLFLRENTNLPAEVYVWQLYVNIRMVLAQAGFVLFSYIYVMNKKRYNFSALVK